MTKLGVLRNQLASLRRSRQTVRAVAALAAPITAALWVLALLFVLDVLFEMSVLQRALMLVLGVSAVGVSFYLLARPLLGVAETDLEMALMVERQQRIDSDLVAALQFESPGAATWGSSQLEGAVVDYVAQLGGGLNVFEGFSRSQMVTRAVTLAITALVVLGSMLVFPGYTGVFFNRLLLGSRHYPTATVIEQVIVNHEPVLQRTKGQETSPDNVNCAQGLPLQFVVQCSGKLPDEGEARLSGASRRTSRDLELRKLSLDERRQRLSQAEERLQAAVEQSEIDIKGPWLLATSALSRFDAPAAATPLAAAPEDRAELATALAAVRQALADWPASANQTAVYLGDMNRLADGVNYKLYLGDAWTDPAAVSMIPLPVVESQLLVNVPRYALSASSKPIDPSARQISVLEGSTVSVSIHCTNKKPLAEAWLTAKTKTATERHALVKQDDEGYEWRLPEGVPAFARVRDEIRFEIQVSDRDNLHLEKSIEGQIRIKDDRPPTASASVVHKLVLPVAQPRVEYRANDDYGISKLLVHTTVERLPAENLAGTAAKSFPFGETPVVPAPGETAAPEEPAEPAEKQTIEIKLEGGKIISPNLPATGYHDLNLASLRLPKGPLVKGDRLKLSLEVIDYRGDLPGVSYLSDPLVLEVSDKSGVLAAISETDSKSEEKLTDILKQQLGIGEQP